MAGRRVGVEGEGCVLVSERGRWIDGIHGCIVTCFGQCDELINLRGGVNVD